MTQKTVNSVVTDYGYDDIDQLTSESRTGYSASYSYDANGNRASKTLNGVTQTYVNDDADKLTSITQGGNTVKSFTYDTAGRTTAVTVGANSTTLAYDYENRITTITYPNSSTNTFAYNGLDTRVSKVDSTGTRTYLRDGAYVTDPVLNDGAANYTPGISERRSSTTKFYHQDRLGSTERLVNTSQSTTDTREYDAFGLLTNSSGSTPTPYGFAGAWGYQEDTDSGLKLLGHRHVDSATGRFLTRDLARDGRNWYTYCGGNPLQFVDPDGFDRIRIPPSVMTGLIQAIKDQAWDMFFLLVEDVLLIPVPDNVKDIINNIKPGRIARKPEGLLRRTVEHIRDVDKINNRGGNPGSVLREIRAFMKKAAGDNRK